MDRTNRNNDYYNNIENTYSASLSNEIAILQRKVYLPLLPLEKISDFVLAAYRYLGKTYCFKDDVYKAKEANFYISMIAPLVEDGESTDIIHMAPNTTNIINGDFQTSDYKTRNYVKLIIPRNIVLQFSNLIPKGTKFNVSFVGGSDSNYAMKIVSVAETVEIPDGEWNDSLYDTSGMSFSGIVSLVQSNLSKIDKEEKRRRKEEKKYARAEEGISEGSSGD